MPAGCFDRASHRRKIAVEDEHHAIGEPTLGERRKAADISEQDRDVTFAALREIDPAPPVGGSSKRRQQRRHLDTPARLQLTGEADILGRADAAEHALLDGIGGIEAADLGPHPHAAGRAAAPATAYRSVRDASDPACLEHAGAGRNLDEAAIRVTDSHEAVPAPPSIADEPREQNRSDHSAAKTA